MQSINRSSPSAHANAFNVHPQTIKEGTFVLVATPRTRAPANGKEGGEPFLQIAKVVGQLEYPAEVSFRVTELEKKTPTRKKKRKSGAADDEGDVMTAPDGFEAVYQREKDRQERRAQREAVRGPTVSVIFYDFYGCSADLVKAYGLNSEYCASLRAAAPTVFPIAASPQNHHGSPNPMASLMSSSMAFGAGSSHGGVMASLGSASSVRQPNRPHAPGNTSALGGFLNVAPPTSPRIRRVSINQTGLSPFTSGITAQSTSNMKNLWLGEGPSPSQSQAKSGHKSATVIPPQGSAADSPHAEAWGNVVPPFLADCDREGNPYVFSVRTQNSALVEQMSFEVSVCDFLARYEALLQKQLKDSGVITEGPTKSAPAGGLANASDSPPATSTSLKEKGTKSKRVSGGLASDLAAFRFGDPDDALSPGDTANRRPSVSFSVGVANKQAAPPSGAQLPRNSFVSFGELPPKSQSPHRAQSPAQSFSPTAMFIQPPTPPQHSLGHTPSFQSLQSGGALLYGSHGPSTLVSEWGSSTPPDKSKLPNIPFSPEPRPLVFESSLSMCNNPLRRQLFTGNRTTDQAMELFLNKRAKNKKSSSPTTTSSLTPATSTVTTGSGATGTTSMASPASGIADATANSSPYSSTAFAARNLSMADSASTGGVHRAISHLQTVVSVPASLAASLSFGSAGGVRGWRSKTHALQETPGRQALTPAIEPSVTPIPTTAPTMPSLALPPHPNAPNLANNYFILLPAELAPNVPQVAANDHPFLGASYNPAASMAHSRPDIKAQLVPSPPPPSAQQPVTALIAQALTPRLPTDTFGAPIEAWSGQAKALHFSPATADVAVVKAFHSDATTAAIVMTQMGCQISKERDDSIAPAGDRVGMVSPFVPSLGMSPPRLIVSSETPGGIELPRFGGGCGVSGLSVSKAPPMAMSTTFAPSAGHFVPVRHAPPVAPPTAIIRKIRVKDIIATSLPILEHAISFRGDQFREGDRIGAAALNSSVGGGGMFALHASKEQGEKMTTKTSFGHLPKGGPPSGTEYSAAGGRSFSRRLSTWLGAEKQPGRSSLDGQRTAPAKGAAHTNAVQSLRVLKPCVQLAGFVDSRVAASFAAISQAYQVAGRRVPVAGGPPLSSLPGDELFVTKRTPTAALAPHVVTEDAAPSSLSATHHDRADPLLSVLTASTTSSIANKARKGLHSNTNAGDTLTSEDEGTVVVPGLALPSPHSLTFQLSVKELHLPLDSQGPLSSGRQLTASSTSPSDTAFADTAKGKPKEMSYSPEALMPLATLGGGKATTEVIPAEPLLVTECGDVTVATLVGPDASQPRTKITLHRLTLDSLAQLAATSDLEVAELYVHFFSFDTTDSALERLAELVAVRFPLLSAFALVHDVAPNIQPLATMQLHKRPPFIPNPTMRLGVSTGLSNSNSGKSPAQVSPSSTQLNGSGNRRSPPNAGLGGSVLGRPKSGGVKSPGTVSLIHFDGGEMMASAASFNISMSNPFDSNANQKSSGGADTSPHKGMLYGRQRQVAHSGGKGAARKVPPSPTRNKGVLDSLTKRPASGSTLVPISNSPDQSLSANHGLGGSSMRRQDPLNSSSSGHQTRCQHSVRVTSPRDLHRANQQQPASSNVGVLASGHPALVVEGAVSVSVGIQAVINAVYFRSMCRQELCDRYVAQQAQSMAHSTTACPNQEPDIFGSSIRKNNGQLTFPSTTPSAALTESLAQEAWAHYFLPLSELAFTHCQVEDENIADLATILSLSERVSLANNRLTGPFLSALCKSYSAIARTNIPSKSAISEGGNGLLNILSSLPPTHRNPALLELNLSCNTIADEDLPPLLDLLDSQRCRHHTPEESMPIRCTLALVDLSYNRIGYRTRSDIAERFTKPVAKASAHWSPWLQRCSPRYIDYCTIQLVITTLLCLKSVFGGRLCLTVSSSCVAQNGHVSVMLSDAGSSYQKAAVRRQIALRAFEDSKHHQKQPLTRSQRDETIAMYILSFFEAKSAIAHCIV